MWFGPDGELISVESGEVVLTFYNFEAKLLTN